MGDDRDISDRQHRRFLLCGEKGANLIETAPMTRSISKLNRETAWFVPADEVRLGHGTRRKTVNILIGGAGGLIGMQLTATLQQQGHSVQRLVRHGADGIAWDPAAEAGPAPERLEGFDAVVHLGGAPLLGRWSTARKREIHDSRVDSTRLLAHTLAGLSRKPAVFAVASAIGFYGDGGEERLSEDHGPGKGFLADVCRHWEAAAEPARRAGIRVVHLRFGVVLSPCGGALRAMLTPFRLGLGGVVGSGRQYFSWITLDDAVRAIVFALQNESLTGPVNIVAPAPCTHREFTRTLGRVLRRPTLLPLPAWLARLLLGEAADALLLAGQRVQPQRLESAGFTFEHPGLEAALRAVLERPVGPAS
jgi:uncharacterized protein